MSAPRRYRLRGGHVTSDIRLGRIAQEDPRSRDYPVRALLDRAAEFRSYTWRLDRHLDQGMTPMCVGFSFAHELNAKPAVVNADELDATRIYTLAQQQDEWAGESYDGTSVLAGAKAMRLMGHYDEYRWAATVDDLVLAVGHHGPAVLGVNWYRSMFEVAPDGELHVDGDVAGGHAILTNRVDVKHERLWLSNSWGVGWGLNGGAWLSFTDTARLLGEDGEACVPVKRERV